jgi:ketosteroid isomerase-like protein
MSQQDVQTVRSAYDAFNRQDIPAVLATYDEAIEWTERGGGRAPAGTFRGPQAVANEVFALVPAYFD